LIASSVFEPKIPSTTIDRFGVRRTARCARRTALPVAPGWMVG
jgi:hypothetical protein